MHSDMTTGRPPLTQLSDEELMFRDAVAGFAEEDVRPRVKEMETAGKLDKALIDGCFELGLMGIEVPEALGGAGGSLTMVAIAVEEISKVDAGAEFAITQPVFDPRQLEKFLTQIDHVRIPMIAGIWPLVSVRNAEFLANEVPGVTVPDEIITRMRKANDKSKEHAVAEGIAIAREMFERVRPVVQGVQVSAPFGKVELALQVFEGALNR